MRVVQPPHRSQWGNPGGTTNRGYGTAQQRPVSSVGRLPVAPPTARANTMSPTRMATVTTSMSNRKYVAPPVNHMRLPQIRPPQPKVESRQVPVSPPTRVMPTKPSDVIDLTDIDERDIDNLHSKRTAPKIRPPKMNRRMINPPRGYQYPMPSKLKQEQQKPHVPKVMPEHGRKPRVMSHHSEVQRLPVAPASKNGSETPRGPESPRSPMISSNAGQEASTTTNTKTASHRLAVASASRAAQKSLPVAQAPKNDTKRAPAENRSMSIADRLRAVNESRPGYGQKDQKEQDDSESTEKETISGPLPQPPQQAKKEAQPSFDSAFNSAYSAYSAYTSCTEHTNYTEPSMDSDITPFDTQKTHSKNRDYVVENELLQHTTGKLAAESTDEFDAKACLVATKELTEMLASDVKEVANFAQSTFNGEEQQTDAASVESPETKTQAKTQTKTESNAKSAQIVQKETNPANACLLETQDCMTSFQEDVTFVAGLGISKIQEACLPEGEEEATSITDGNKNKAAEKPDESGCVSETADCMQSFKDDVSYVAGMGASKIMGNKGNTSTVGGKDDESGVFAASADCFVQLKEDIKYGVAQMKGMKLSELEVRGLVVSIAQGLNEPIFLTEGDTGSVLTDDFRSSSASVNDLDSLDDSVDRSSLDRSNADSAPSIDVMSADPLPPGMSVVDSIKRQIENEALRGEEFVDPVIEEIKKVDPPGDDDEDSYAIKATKSSNGRADPPAAVKPVEQPSTAPGDVEDGEESTGTPGSEDVYAEETEEMESVEETIEEEAFDEVTVEEEIEEPNESEALENPEDEVSEQEDNVTVETEMETVSTPETALDVDEKSESTVSHSAVLEALEKADDVPFPTLLPDEI